MSATKIEELKRLTGFSGDDSRVLSKLLPEIRCFFPEIIEEFSRGLSLPRKDNRALGEAGGSDGLDELLHQWLEEIFLGPHDAALFKKHLGIGTRLIESGLSQIQILLAGGLVRRRLQEAVAGSSAVEEPDSGHALSVLQRILDLELALISGCDCGREIGARKQAEMALHRERDLVKKYLDVAGAIICVIATDQTFTLINRKGCELLGWEAHEIIGKPFHQFIPKRYREQVQAVFQQLIAGDIEPVAQYENPLLSRSGEERIVEWHNTVLRDNDGKIIGTLSSGIDVTDRRRMETQMVEQASLARLGEMAAVVAHEVRNTLAGISGALQVMSTQGRSPRADEFILRDIFERIGALNNAVEDILFFAKPAPPYICELSILPLIQEAADRLRQDPSYRRTVVRVGGEDLRVPCDANLIKQALFSLLLNAAQAVDCNGEVSVAISNSGGICRIDVEDHGSGIPPELREKIFEPFFTTKCRGTGLGLPITKRIVQAHNGELRLAAPENGGTRITIELPLNRPTTRPC